MDDSPPQHAGADPRPVDYRTAPFELPPARHWITKPRYWIILLVPSLPLLALLLPDAAFINADGTDPWYAIVTRPLWLFAAVYVRPPTIIAASLGVAEMTPLWVTVVLAYTLGIGYGLCALLSRPG
jgi:hypothetical protein